MGSAGQSCRQAQACAIACMLGSALTGRIHYAGARRIWSACATGRARTCLVLEDDAHFTRRELSLLGALDNHVRGCEGGGNGWTQESAKYTNLGEPAWDILFLGLSALSKDAQMVAYIGRENDRNADARPPVPQKRTMLERNRARDSRSTAERRQGEATVLEDDGSRGQEDWDTLGQCAEKDGSKIIVGGETFQWVRKPEALSEGDFCIRRLKDGDLGSHAYLLTRQGAERLLRMPARLPTDTLVVQAVEQGAVGGLVLVPSLVVQGVCG